MALESASWITQLVATNPASTDKIGQGDDHLRMVKTVLKNSFPGTSTQPVIPDPSGNSNKLLTNDGTDNSWVSTVQDLQINTSSLKDYAENVNAIGSIGGGTQDIDLDLGNVVTATVDTSATTFTFSNPAGASKSSSFTLFLVNGGSQTVTWPASVKWPSGVAPSLTESGTDIIGFTTVDGGTNWYGFASLNFS